MAHGASAFFFGREEVEGVWGDFIKSEEKIFA